MEEKLLGYAAVDSGGIVIVDPCYLIGKDAVLYCETWDEWCEKNTGEIEKGFMRLHFPVHDEKGEAGVLLRTGVGDGVFPVYGIYEGNKLMKVEVQFQEQEEQNAAELRS